MTSRLKIYDPVKADYRAATQDDLDRLVVMARAYRRLETALLDAGRELQLLDSPRWSCGHRHESRGAAMVCRLAEEQKEKADAGQ
jgi:hypothetical protein